jgi:hypothetical protein
MRNKVAGFVDVLEYYCAAQGIAFWLAEHSGRYPWGYRSGRWSPLGPDPEPGIPEREIGFT